MIILYSDENIDILGEEHEDFPECIFIHSYVKYFSISRYKDIKCIWQDIVQQLKQQEYKYVLCIPPGKKEEKWESKFGFKYLNLDIGDKKLMGIKLWEV